MPRLLLTDVPKDSTITATFEIVTPMFLGDADQKATAIRPTAIKGALRFWWRAMNGHLDLKALAEKEAKLFGSTNSGGVFSLAVSESKIKKNDSNPSGERDPAIGVPRFGALHYLLGQGLNATRNAIIEGQFTLKLVFIAKAKESDRQEIEQALQLFGVLGSLGSRARHGWGSVSLIDVKNAQHIVVPKTEEEYQQLLQTFLTGKTTSLPEFTAFSGNSRIDLAGSNKDPMTLLNKTGSELQMYRSFGNNGKVGSKDAERNFTHDHDLVLDHIQGKQADIAPKRVVFGLPHNYFYSKGKGKADVNAKVDNNETRRASPLFTHIQKIGAQYMLVHALLPAKFLPHNGKIVIKGGKGQTAQITPNVDYTVITNFMDRFTGATKVLAK
jgi:CRISPR-associated protein Cmr1